MPIDPQRAQALFLAAIEVADATERAALLERECGGDAELRQRVEVLLAAHNDSAGLPAADPQGTGAFVPGGETVELVAGSVFAGRFKIREKLGEGGMGAVYIADQTEPVSRRVALKIIKTDVASGRLLARFEQERPALALMDHPNIAKVLDAGVADSTPYFAMELIKGVPITKYCDEAKLTPKQRLELLVPVCQAVQHAHQKAIIHRDLKPLNILVGLYDGRPVPKVIDFGVAKITGPKLTDESVYTEVGQMIGTLEYMSPEQAELNNLDIDTRTDVYALGVILYELLTGTLPFSRNELKAAGFAEMLRMIKEVEPPKPSTRLSHSGSLPSVAAVRQTEPKKLTRLVRGDLDWVVMKALAKDRTRRYETANGLAMDIQRFLINEPVVAGPPSAAYRLKKFVNRNQPQVIAAALVLLALVAGIVSTSWGLVRAKQSAEAERLAKLDAEAKKEESEKQKTRAEAGEKLAGDRLVQVEAEKQKVDEEKRIADAVRDFLQKKLLAQAAMSVQADTLLEFGGFPAEANRNVTVRELLDRAAAELTPEKIEARFPKQPLLQAELLNTVGLTYQGVGEFAQAVELLQRAAALSRQHRDPDHADTLAMLNNLAMAYFVAGKTPAAIKLLEEVRRVREKKLGAEHPSNLPTLSNLGLAYVYAGMAPAAITLLKQVRELREKELGPDHPSTLLTLMNLGAAYLADGNLREAMKLFQHVHDAREKRLGPDHPSTLTALNNLVLAYLDGRPRDAIPLAQRAYASIAEKLGPEHPAALVAGNNLAGAYLANGKTQAAIPLLEQVSGAQAKKLGPEHPETLTTLNNLGKAYVADGRLEAAVKLLEQVRDARQRKLGADHPHTLTTLNNLALAYEDVGRLSETIKLLQQVRDAREKKLGADHPHTLITLHNLATAYRNDGNLPLAIKLLQEVRVARAKNLGPDHPDTLRTINNLATAYLTPEKLPEAIKLFEQVRKVQEKTLPPDHPDTLTTINNLAMAYQLEGKIQSAINLFMQVREVRARVLGADHPDTLKTLDCLAGAYQAEGKSAKAIELYHQFRDAQRMKLGADHPQTLLTLNNLAAAYVSTGKFAEAITLLELVREAKVKKFGLNHDSTLNTLHNLAAAYWRAKRFDKSIPLFEDLVKRRATKSGRDHPDTLMTVAFLGVNYRDAGQLDNALLLLEEAYQKGKPHASLAWVANGLIEAYAKAGKSTEAAKLIQEQLVAARLRTKPESPQFAAALAIAGRRLLELKEYSNAEPILRECLALCERLTKAPLDVKAPGSLTLAPWQGPTAKSWLGASLLGQKKYTDAEPLLLGGYEGLKRHEKIIAPQNRHEIADAIRRLIEFYDATDNNAEAARWRKELEAVNKGAAKAPTDP